MCFELPGKVHTRLGRGNQSYPCRAWSSDEAGRQPSMAECYTNRAGYVACIRTAVREVVSQGFRLPEDASTIIDAVAATPILGVPAPATTPR